MNNYKVLFHFHTEYSYDASIRLKQLAKIVKKYRLTHVVITEHNNIDSLSKAEDIFRKLGCMASIIPACEYSTEVGDIIICFIDEKLEYDSYLDLVSKAKKRGGLIILPHPYKRKSYPKQLIDAIDCYEISNLRGANNYFDNSRFKNKAFIFGSDAHNFFDLPGYINHYYCEKEFKECLLSEIPIPSIHRRELIYINLLSKLISKIIRVLKLR